MLAKHAGLENAEDLADELGGVHFPIVFPEASFVTVRVSTASSAIPRGGRRRSRSWRSGRCDSRACVGGPRGSRSARYSGSAATIRILSRSMTSHEASGVFHGRVPRLVRRRPDRPGHVHGDPSAGAARGGRPGRAVRGRHRGSGPRHHALWWRPGWTADGWDDRLSALHWVELPSPHRRSVDSRLPSQLGSLTPTMSRPRHGQPRRCPPQLGPRCGPSRPQPGRHRLRSLSRQSPCLRRGSGCSTLPPEPCGRSSPPLCRPRRTSPAAPRWPSGSVTGCRGTSTSSCRDRSIRDCWRQVSARAAPPSS